MYIYIYIFIYIITLYTHIVHPDMKIKKVIKKYTDWPTVCF